MDQDAKTTSNRGKGRGRGRGRKKAAEHEKNSEEPTTINHEVKSNEPEPITLDLDADITQLEAPTFSTINKGPPEPMLRLSWDHKTHLIGEKVINPMIHCCDKCEAPILIYGRMIPCKHVFCLTCAERESKTCPRCQEKFVRIEKTGLGTVFMCTFGGTRYGNSGCRRTYLSQRDLLAHINHRHVVGTATTKENIGNNQITTSSKVMPTISPRSKPSGVHHGAVSSDPRIQSGSNLEYFYKISPSSHTSLSQPSHTHRQASHHHSTAHHHSELHPATTQPSNTSHNSVSYPLTTTAQQSSQRHLSASATQPLMPPAEFVNQMMVSNYPPPTPTSVTTLPGMRSNLITIQTHESTVDPGNSSIGVPMTTSFPHQAFSPQFPPTSSAGIPFPVPPPSQTGINALSQASSQFYPSAPISYPLNSTQRPTLTQFSPNSPGQPILSQSQMMPGPPPPPQMVPPPRRTQFSRDSVAQQQFPVTPSAHRWHQPNQPQFY